jgi:hypothetical protein
MPKEPALIAHILDKDCAKEHVLSHDFNQPSLLNQPEEMERRKEFFEDHLQHSC